VIPRAGRRGYAQRDLVLHAIRALGLERAGELDHIVGERSVSPERDEGRDSVDRQRVACDGEVLGRGTPRRVEPGDRIEYRDALARRGRIRIAQVIDAVAIAIDLRWIREVRAAIARVIDPVAIGVVADRARTDLAVRGRLAVSGDTCEANPPARDGERQGHPGAHERLSYHLGKTKPTLRYLLGTGHQGSFQRSWIDLMSRGYAI